VRRFSGILPFKAKVSFNKAGEKKIRTNKNQEITKLNKFSRYEGHSEVKEKKAGLPLGARGCLQQRGPQDVQLFHTILFRITRE
jgi:hypothetical protein